MPATQIVAPIALPAPSQRGLRLLTSHDLYNSLSATLSGERPSTPVRRIQEDDYTVPAPPPPSPVSLRAVDHWHPPARR
ncbi:hypothetical protein CDD81_7725 [Ophiocordyceps australis]|uniref:Uncharacterized protein n=1 Tax=Ophiocordyceps australis TaxID=1399860 RepID=A0A2C5Y3D3_9HYPO|nr:hypothetical protein CDD81_7725 [Ophiocordyceps australis]